MSNNDLISRMALYEKTAEWEAQALHMVELHLHDEDTTEWRKWSTILAERSAFKHDVADAPAADKVVKGKWLRKYNDTFGWLWKCSECHYGDTRLFNFCPNCGADMRGETE